MVQKFLEGEAFLNSVYEKLRQTNNFRESMDELFYGLRDLRNSLTNDEWRNFSLRCAEHPLSQLVHQDPFTFRAFSKPRGYAGDAVLIDFIYGDDSVREKVDTAPEIGKKVYEYTTSAPASCAVRERRDIIARMIDEISDAVSSPHILSVACGHLSEANHANAVRNKCVGRYIAFDQDLRSLRVVEERFGEHDNIECVNGTVKELIKKQTELGKFDLAYALGLFDYLPQPVAKRMTNVMFGMLRPGGRILIGNFLPGIKDVGYMESYMGWELIYRNTGEMEELGADIEDNISEKRVFIEKNQNIVFLEICKT